MKTPINKLILKSLFIAFLLFAGFIASGQKNTLKENRTVKSIQKNSVCIENLVILPSLNYERLLPISDHTGIILKAGVSYYAKIFFTSEALFLAGKNKHFAELGGGYDYGAMIVGIYGRLGYRYISKKGLVLKAGLQIVKNIPVFPYAGLGFAF